MKLALSLIVGICVLCAGNAAFSQNTITNNNSTINIVSYGGTFTYSVTWSFSYPTHPWYFTEFPNGSYANQVNLAVLYYTSFPNQYTYTYTFNGVDSSNEGYYFIYYGDYGNNYAASPNVYLHISPAILTQPQNTICLSGSTTSMGIAAGPSTATFQWIDSATGNVLYTGTSFSPTTANSGKRIYCRVSNSYGSVSSSNALLTVGAAPSITYQPSGGNAAYGNGVTFFCNTSGSQPLVIQWYKNGLPIQGANLNYLTIQSVTNTDAATYQVVITNSFGSVTSSKAILNVGAPPMISTQPSNQTTVSNGIVTFNVLANGDPTLSYQWYKDGNALSDGNEYTGSTTTNLNINPVTLADEGSYSVYVSNNFGNTNSISASLTIRDNSATSPYLGISTYNNSPVVFFPTCSGTNLILQMTTNLATPNWITVTNAVPFSGYQITNPPSSVFFKLN